MKFSSKKVTGTMHDMRKLLRSVGISPTIQRLQVAELVLSCHQHLCADKVYERANEAGNHVSRATIYNTLRLFVSHGLVREIYANTNCVFYDSNVSHHHHFFDAETGELTDIESNQLEILGVPEPPFGKKISEVDLVIRLKSQG